VILPSFFPTHQKLTNIMTLQLKLALLAAILVDWISSLDAQGTANTTAAVGDDAAATDDCAGGLCDTTPYIRKLYAAHGILMIFGFLILMPLAIGGSLLRKHLPGDLWFTIHQFLNWTAVVCIFTSFSIVVTFCDR